MKEVSVPVDFVMRVPSLDPILAVQNCVEPKCLRVDEKCVEFSSAATIFQKDNCIS